MEIRQHPLWAAFPVGRWFGTDVRISVWLPLTLLVLIYQLQLQLGVLVWMVLFASILLHEFGHVFAARRTGGQGDEILIWPLGGLAAVQPAPHLNSELFTTLAGPLVNLLICLATGYWVVAADYPAGSFALTTVPNVAFDALTFSQLAVLTFSINFKLLVLNLLPIYPLDMGQLVFHLAKECWDRQTAKLGTLWVGMALSIVLCFIGYALKDITFLFIATTLLSFGTFDFCMAQLVGQREDSAGMYDFSQGYTSLEGEFDAPPAQPGPIQRWKQEREARRREKEELQRLESERRLDQLLEKINQHGMSALSEEEQRFLRQASLRYRSSGSGPA